MSYTTLELITAVRDEFGEDTAATSAVSDVQILQFLNQSQRELCVLGNLLLTCAHTATTAAQEEYPIPPDYAKICAVFIHRTDGLQRKLRPIAMQERNPLQTQSTDQRAYYVWGVNVSGMNRYYIGLQDIPSATSATDDIFIYYRQYPASMVSGGTAPEVPEGFQDGLISGALVKIYNRLAPRDPAKWLPLLDRNRARWEQWKVEAKRYVNPLGFDTPRQIIDTGNYTIPSGLV